MKFIQVVAPPKNPTAGKKNVTKVYIQRPQGIGLDFGLYYRFWGLEAKNGKNKTTFNIQLGVYYILKVALFFRFSPF